MIGWFYDKSPAELEDEEIFLFAIPDCGFWNRLSDE